MFMPEVGDIYGPDFQTYVEVENVARPLCGASRPGHFRGVATVVLKLFNVVSPTAAYFGRKDYQQLQVIKTMARPGSGRNNSSVSDRREDDGLAMSSRNAYLSPSERQQATCLYQALQTAQRILDRGEQDAKVYVKAMSDTIQKEPDAQIDYVSLVHPETLQDLERVADDALAVLAVRIGKTRLIDNMLLQGPALRRDEA
jgi:pantoate--beta-alanine ligase